MGIEEAITYTSATALARDEDVRRTGRPDKGLLTAQEFQVARLTSLGLKDWQIGQKLTIATRTARGHGENIRAKLGFHSRAQVAAWYVRLMDEAHKSSAAKTETEAP